MVRCTSARPSDVWCTAATRGPSLVILLLVGLAACAPPPGPAPGPGGAGGLLPARCGDGVVDDGEACDDGNAVDNDACTTDCQPSECGNGVDDDEDGRIDGDDPACGSGPTEAPDTACSDLVDNDDDGAIDLADPDCAGDPAGEDESGVAAPGTCGNGVDDDGDGDVDGADVGCQVAGDEGLDPECADGLDNDNDGAIDLDDVDCGGVAGGGSESEPAPDGACDDDLDNDGDGLVDFPLDPDCAGPSDDESGVLPDVCGDGFDNDGDGFVDGDDPACASGSGAEHPEPECADGVDNDGDDLIDFPDDADCTTEAGAELGVLPVVPIANVLSSVLATPRAGLVADGVAAADVTVVVRDGVGNPVAGATVVLQATGAGNVFVQPSRPTDSLGVATGRVAATVAGARRLIAVASLGAGNVRIAMARTLVFVPAPATGTPFAEGATVVPIEFQVPAWGETAAFVVSAVVPVQPGDYVPAEQRWALDGTVVQTEVVSRDALDRPRSVEVIGVVGPRGPGTAGSYASLPLQATSALPGPALVPPNLGPMTMTLRAPSPASPSTLVDFVADVGPTAGSNPVVMKDGPVTRVVRYHNRLTGVGAATLGVHTYFTYFKDDPTILVDVRVHNQHIDPAGPDPYRGAVGEVFFDELTLAAPTGYGLAAQVVRVSMNDTDPTLLRVVASRGGGDLHVFPAGALFQRRLALYPLPGGDKTRAVEAANFARLGFVRSDDPAHRTWWRTPAYLAGGFRLARLTDVYVAPATPGSAATTLRGAPAFDQWMKANDVARLTQSLRTGTVQDGFTYFQATDANPDKSNLARGPWHPVGMSNGQGTGGSDIHQFDFWQLTRHSLVVAALVNDMTLERNPQGWYDGNGNDISDKEWAGANGGTVPFGFFINYVAGNSLRYFQNVDGSGGVAARPFNGGASSYRAALLGNWQSPNDGQHLIRFTKNLYPLVQQANDPLARDNLLHVATYAIQENTNQPHASNPYIQGESLHKLAPLMANPANQGRGRRGYGRGFAHPQRAAVEWYAVAPPAWRAAHVDFFEDLAAWLVFATMPAGVIEWQSTQKIYDNYVGVDGCAPAPAFASTQAIGTNFHALTWWSLAESVLAGRDEPTRRALLAHLDAWARGFYFSDNFRVTTSSSGARGENKAAVALADITGVNAPTATPFPADRHALPASLPGSVVFAAGNPFASAATAWPPAATTATDCVQAGQARSVGHHSSSSEPDQGAYGFAIGARVQAALGVTPLDVQNPWLRRAQEFGSVRTTMQARVDDAIDLRTANGGFNDHVLHMAPTLGEMQAVLSP
jgi:cysteine-rich repeat protein